MIRNPELRRNLWITFSPARLVMMPMILGLLLGFAGYPYRYDPASGGTAIIATARCLFFAVMAFFGFTSAGSSVAVEIQDGTWDQQRMGALSPWSMTWGKLLGSTAYAWYGGGLCLAVFMLAAASRRQLFSMEGVTEILIWISAALLGSALAMLCSFSGHAGQRTGVYGVLSIFLVAIPFFFLWSPNLYRITLFWWDIPISLHQFVLVSTCFFMGCAIFALWRVMCVTLQCRTTPWAFPLFLVLLALYLTGFVDEQTVRSFFPLCLGMISLFATYGILIAHNPDERVEITWKTLAGHAGTGQWRKFLETLPLWPVALAVVLVCIPATLVFPRDRFVFHYDIMSRTWPGISNTLILVAGFGVAMRDVCVYLFLMLSRNAGRKTNVVLILYLFIVHILLPLFAFRMPWLAGIIQPLSFQAGLEDTLMAALAHLLISIALLSWKVMSLDLKRV